MLILYILMRQDLQSMGYGKGAAQASHASNAFTEFEVIRPLEGGYQVNPKVHQWRKETNQGFGTVLTVAVPDLQTLEKLIPAAQDLGFAAREVVDDTYPYHIANEFVPLISPDVHTKPPQPVGNGQHVCFRSEITCGYVFGEKEDLALILSRFGLVPNT